MKTTTTIYRLKHHRDERGRFARKDDTPKGKPEPAKSEIDGLVDRIFEVAVPLLIQAGKPHEYEMMATFFPERSEPEPNPYTLPWPLGTWEPFAVTGVKKGSIVWLRRKKIQ